MRIKTITMENYTTLDAAELSLPAEGLVLVTGPNGHGKSAALVDAWSVAGWGRTARDTSPRPWRKDMAGRVHLTDHDGLDIVRTRSASDRPGLEWSHGAHQQTYDTQQKSQPELERLIGTYNLWRKTRAFSSADADHFSKATDSERKLLLEAILGNEDLDTAFSLCHAELRTAQDALAALKASRVQLEHEYAMESQRLNHAVQAIDAAKPEEVAGVDANAVSAELREARGRVAELEERQNEAGTELVPVRAALEAAQYRVQMIETGTCVGCLRPVDAKTKKRITREVVAAERTAESKEQLITAELAAVNVEITARREEVRTLQRTLDKVEAARSLSRRMEQRLADATLQQEHSEAAIDSLLDQLDGHGDEFDLALRRVARLRAADFVLGVKGVRSHLLTRTLGAIESLSADWLRRLSDEAASLELRSYTEKKTGGTSDSIALMINGWGGGEGYHACSAGQRRLVDLSLLIGAGVVAGAALNTDTGTAVFDEVFDILDKKATARVAIALEEMAKTRCVVVISHSDSLRKTINADLHLHVEDGTIMEI